MNQFLKYCTTVTASLILADISNAQGPLPPAAPPVPQDPVLALPLVDANKVLAEGIVAPLLDGEGVADLYRKFTGKRVLVSKATKAIEISIVQEGKMTYGEAASLLEKTCFLEGLVFVPSGPNEVKLLPAPNVGNAGGYRLVTDRALLPDGEELVAYVMSFDHIKPEEAMTIFTGVVSQLNAHGSVVPVPNANALIIRENSQLIRTLVALKDRIDIPQELTMKKWIALRHADAEETAASIKSIMELSAQNNTQLTPSAGGAAPAVPAANGNTAAPVANQSRTAAPKNEATIQVISDLRTNRILLIGRPIDVGVAESLVEGFDAPLDERNFFKHKLKFLSVSDFLPIAQDAISQVSVNAGGNTSSSSGGGASSRQSGSANNRNIANNDSRSNNNFGGNNNYGRNGGGGSRSTGGNLSESGVEGPESLIVNGKTLLVADNSSNTLIIKGPPQSIKVVKDLINEMDTASDQVQITAIFGRYNLTDATDFGVDFARTYQKTHGGDSGFAGGNNTSGTLFPDPTSLTDLGSFINGEYSGGSFANVTGLSLYGNIGKHFNATLNALQQDGKFKITARPRVFTTNNRRAILSSGQQVAVPTNSFTQGGSGVNGSQSTNIDFRDVLLELEVIPLINSKDEVTLQISFTNDNIVGNSEIDGNKIPTIGTERLETTVTVPNGGIIALGGLITERNSKNETGIPILKRIPGFKKLFSKESKNIVRDELVIFISPRIVNGEVSLLQLQADEAQNSELMRDLQNGDSILPPKYIDVRDAKPAKKKRKWFSSSKEEPEQTKSKRYNAVRR